MLWFCGVQFKQGKDEGHLWCQHGGWGGGGYTIVACSWPMWPEVTIFVRGYHFPNASIWFLSPHMVLESFDGGIHQSINRYCLTLCLAPSLMSHMVITISPSSIPVTLLLTIVFGGTAFVFMPLIASSILTEYNQNASLAQKEILPWDQWPPC